MQTSASAETSRLFTRIAALSAGVALAAAITFLRPPPVAVVAGLVIARYIVLSVLLGRSMRLARAEEAVAGDPTRAELHIALAHARLEHGHVAEAVCAFRQGIGLDPELDMDRPAELARKLVSQADLTPARRRATVYLITAALFDRMLEDLHDAAPTPVARCSGDAPGQEGSQSVQDVAARLTGSARERFLDQCRGLVQSLRVEIAGLEQLVVAIDGSTVGDDAVGHSAHGGQSTPQDAERARQRRMLDREIVRLRTHAGKIDSAIRQTQRTEE